MSLWPRNRLRWSVIRGDLYLNYKTDATNELKLVVMQKPLKVTLNEGHSGLSADPVTHQVVTDEIFGTDDGFNDQRESLLALRVAAAAMMSVPGRDAGFKSRQLLERAEYTEREMEGVKDLLLPDVEVTNEPRVIDIDR